MQHSRRNLLASLGALLTVPVVGRLALGAGSVTCGERAGEFLRAVHAGDVPGVSAFLKAEPLLARVRDEHGRSAYVLAHVHGHRDVAQLVLASGIELDMVESVLAEDWDRFGALCEEYPERRNAAHAIGGTPLYAAALSGGLANWRLRGAGCLVDQTPAGGTGFTAARGAMESAHRSWARIALSDLCSNGSDINAAQRGGSSVLHGAVSRRDELLVRLAVRKGADVDARNDVGQTPLELARAMQWAEGAQLLENEDQLLRDNRGSRFLFNARRERIERPSLAHCSRAQQSEVTGKSHNNLKRVRELVSKNRDLVFSISSDDELAIEASAHIGNHDIIRYHLDNGAPLSLPTAVSLQDYDGVEFLLEHDPTLVNERGAHDFPVMWYAVLGRGSVEMASFLSRRGVDLDQHTKGTTALHWCVKRGDLKLAQWLVEHGADAQAVGFNWNRDGETPMQLARKDDYGEMLKLLKGLGATR